MKIKKYTMLAAIVFLLSNLTTIVSAETSGSTAADITFESGTLTLAEMSFFSFGTHTISSSVQTYPALQSSVFLDVRDLRGTGEGWKITALASRFNPGSNPTLPGASISLINGTAVSAPPASTAPTVYQNITLDCDGVASANIASAALNSGLGVWTVEWNGNANNNTNAALTLPGGVATVGTHTATITWTLYDGP